MGCYMMNEGHSYVRLCPCSCVVVMLALLEMRLSAVRPASEEAMTVLEEVIMFTFQQCVYYLTKVSLTTVHSHDPLSQNRNI